MAKWEKIDICPVYSVSSKGKIRNDRTGKILKLNKDLDGYLQCNLSNVPFRKMVKVHRIVATAFIPNPENKPMVNHIDGDKSNNKVKNLEWVTNQENQDHFWKYLDSKKHKKRRSKAHKGKGLLGDNPNAKAVRRTEDGMVFSTIKEAAEFSGADRSDISMVCHGHRKKAGGYHWEFVERRERCKSR